MADDAVARRLGEAPRIFAVAVRVVLRLNAWAHRVRYLQLTLRGDVYIRGWLHISHGTSVVIGAGTRVTRGVHINGGGRVRIGEECLPNGCWIGARSEVVIEDQALISNCDITDSDFHNLAPEARQLPPDDRATKPVHVGRNVWIGARAIVLKGTVIGSDSMIGAGAVVRGVVPCRVLMTGNPGRVVRHL
ncbi:acyltransferase [Ornithinimicrobium murale]|uniref:acyltransferase n=1 Tax=Ornithinimicrobium murale TaxID=1050153 RepID=UPI000E0D5695|nr:acyltransferase [Ornithinimicrobium murale]